MKLLLALLLLGASSAWADSTVLFHESFGDNSSSAREWKDSYSEKTGIAAVYDGIGSYTITNAKQSKNNMGSTKSGLIQTTQNKDASIIMGPLNVSDYNTLCLTYQWKASSTKGTYTTKAYYATSADGNYTEISGTGNVSTQFVERSYSLPADAQVSTLYLKIVWNTSNTQGYIDEVDLTGIANSGEEGGETSEEVTPTVTFASTTASVEVGATVTNAITKPGDLSVTYGSSNTAIATVDATTGEVTGVTAGTSNITASWNKVEGKYLAGSVSYTITVTEKQGGGEDEPTETITKDVTFDFTNPSAYGFDTPTSKNTDVLVGNNTIESEGIILSFTDGSSTKTKFYYGTNGIDLRLYKGGGSMTVTAPTGFHVVGVKLNDGLTSHIALTATPGTLSEKTDWSGNAESVTFKASDANYLKKAVVSIAPFVNVGEAGYATFVTPCGTSFPNNVSAYAITANNAKSVTLTQVTEAAEGTALVVKAAKGTSLLDYDADATSVDGNLLLVSDGTVTGNATSIYVLANGEDGIGFYLLDSGETVPNGKAYLSATSGAKGFLGFSDDSEATGIRESASASREGHALYNLSGARVARPTKGLYIMGGKKVIIK